MTPIQSYHQLTCLWQPDSQKTTTEKAGDSLKGNLDSAASTLQPQGEKSNAQKVLIPSLFSYLIAVAHQLHSRLVTPSLVTATTTTSRFSTRQRYAAARCPHCNDTNSFSPIECPWRKQLNYYCCHELYPTRTLVAHN